MRLIFTFVIGHKVVSTVKVVPRPNLSERADRVGGQLRGDKECPISGVTKFGSLEKRVPESDARSVCRYVCCVSVCGKFDHFRSCSV